MDGLSEYSTVRHRPEQVAGRSRSKKRQTSTTTCDHAGYGFLRQSFQPLIEKDWKFSRKKNAVENGFFQSLSNLCDFYNLDITDYSGHLYPFNINMAYSEAVRQMDEKRKELHLFIIEEDNGTITLATIKVLDTGPSLYYIPVRPLAKLLEDTKTKKTGQMLLSVFAWLYQVVQVSYYWENSSYLSGTYSMIEQWVLESEGEYEEEEYREYQTDFRLSDYFGKKLIRSIRHPRHLVLFEKRVTSFKPIDTWESELANICGKALQLYKEYPNASIFRNICESIFDRDEEENIVSPEQYLSFCWSFTGTLAEQVFHTVNADLQECGHIDEPQTIQSFATPQTEELHHLDFEDRLLTILDELVFVIKQIE
jgi:hypothetical protein